MRRHPLQRGRSGLFRGHAVREGDQPIGRHHRVLGIRAHYVRVGDAGANGKVRDARAQRGHDSGALLSRRERRRYGVPAGTLVYVDEVDPGGFDLHERLAGAGRGPLDVLVTQGVGAAGRVPSTMLADDEPLGAVMRGPEGAVAVLPAGAIHISMSTISPALAARLAERHRAAGQVYVAAPVFGRPEAAAAKQLWIVAAGPADALTRCRPVLDALGQGVIVVGDDPPHANVIKLAGNFLLAAAIEAMGEAFALGRKYGIAPADLLDIVNGRLIRSPIYENYGKLIAEERYEPAGF